MTTEGTYIESPAGVSVRGLKPGLGCQRVSYGSFQADSTHPSVK